MLKREMFKTMENLNDPGMCRDYVEFVAVAAKFCIERLPEKGTSKPRSASRA